MQGLLNSLYVRHRRRYLPCAIAVVGAFAASAWLTTAVIGSHVLELDAGDGTLAAGAVELTLLPALALALFLMRADLRELHRWILTREPPDQEGRAGVLGIAIRLPARASVAATATALILIPVATYFYGIRVPAGGLDLRNGAFVLLGYAFGLLYSATAVYIAIEFATRPIRSELDVAASRTVMHDLPSASIARKLVISLAATALVLGFFLTAALLPAHPPLEDALLALAFTFAFVAVIAVTLALPITANALAPIDDLRAATVSVAAGDLDVRVPITSADELGELAASFNEMVSDLQDRESLRSRNSELLDDVREKAAALVASQTRIVAASDSARRRVELDLHDGAQQHLVLLRMRLAMARQALNEDPAAAKLIDEGLEDLDQALSELRQLARGTYPAVLASGGLREALADATAGAAIEGRLDCDGLGRYAPELEAGVYFCCLEALQNAAKHAGEGAAVEVSVAEDDGALLFELVDDGRGFMVATDGAEAGMGMQSMDDRIGALGGELTITSAPGKGTRVAGRVPIADRDMDAGL
ncbi:MAG: HAMP domain-containing protein [Solirubrobacterales bacterium]|nr:HAMP domain-containing protein [Solirubrobacterales bacterium]